MRQQDWRRRANEAYQTFALAFNTTTAVAHTGPMCVVVALIFQPVCICWGKKCICDYCKWCVPMCPARYISGHQSAAGRAHIEGYILHQNECRRPLCPAGCHLACRNGVNVCLCWWLMLENSFFAPFFHAFLHEVDSSFNQFNYGRVSRFEAAAAASAFSWGHHSLAAF